MNTVSKAQNGWASRMPLIAFGFTVAAILTAGFYPFDLHPKNMVSFNEKEKALDFFGNAMITGSDALSFVKQQKFVTKAITIELVVKPRKEIVEGLGCIFMFNYHGKVGHVMVVQWRKYLDIISCWSGYKRELTADSVLVPGNKRCITIRSGASGTAIFVDGQEACCDRGLFLLGNSKEIAGRMILGNDENGRAPWSGLFYGCALYDSCLTDYEIRENARSWLASDSISLHNVRPVLCYFFNKKDSIVPSCSGVGHTLLVPSRIPIIKRNVLTPPWKDFRNAISYYSDILVNILGFMPFGFFLMLLLSKMDRRITRKKALIIVCGSGFLLSLCLETGQIFLPMRDSQTLDVITNSIGAFFGGWLCIKSSLYTTVLLGALTDKAG